MHQLAALGTGERMPTVRDKASHGPSSRRNRTWHPPRSMVRETGMSQTAISRIWRAFGIKPHLTETFKLSTDSEFIGKVRDIGGTNKSCADYADLCSMKQ